MKIQFLTPTHLFYYFTLSLFLIGCYGCTSDGVVKKIEFTINDQSKKSVDNLEGVVKDSSEYTYELFVITDFRYKGTIVEKEGNPVPNYSWDFNDDGIIDKQDESGTYFFQNPGRYTAKFCVDDVCVKKFIHVKEVQTRATLKLDKERDNKKSIAEAAKKEKEEADALQKEAAKKAEEKAKKARLAKQEAAEAKRKADAAKIAEAKAQAQVRKGNDEAAKKALADAKRKRQEEEKAAQRKAEEARKTAEAQRKAEEDRKRRAAEAKAKIAAAEQAKREAEAANRAAEEEKKRAREQAKKDAEAARIAKAAAKKKEEEEAKKARIARELAAAEEARKKQENALLVAAAAEKKANEEAAARKAAEEQIKKTVALGTNTNFTGATSFSGSCGDFTITYSSMSITPKKNIALMGGVVYASSCGAVTLKLTGNGINLTETFEVSPNKNELVFYNLEEEELLANKTYSLSIQTKSSDNCSKGIPKLINGNACGKNSSGDKNMTINYNGKISLFKIKYLY